MLTALQLLALLALPPLLLGVINQVKARAAGRVGPPVLQLYWDLARLVRKDSVVSRTTTWVFIAGPAVGLAAVLLAGLFVPLGAAAPLSFGGDFVLFVYLFGLGRFFLTSAALDTGSPFEGMGASRDVSFAALAEVSLLFGLLALAALARDTSLAALVSAARPDASAPLVLVSAGVAIVLLAENARVPVDDPNTHLELTMIHEAMILDHSGPALAAILYGASLKLFVLAALLARLVLPSIADPLAAFAASLGAIIAIAVAIGVIESVMARLRMARVPALLVTGCLLSAFGFLMAVS